jgi:hypothetical protein
MAFPLIPLIGMGIAGIVGSQVAPKQDGNNTQSGKGGSSGNLEHISVQNSIDRILTSDDSGGWKQYREKEIFYDLDQLKDWVINEVNVNNTVKFFGKKSDYNWPVTQNMRDKITAYNNLYTSFKTGAEQTRVDIQAGKWIPVIGNIGVSLSLSNINEYLNNLETGRKLRRQILPLPPFGNVAYI